LEAAHGRDDLIAALRRAVAFGRWWASDVRSILAAGTGVAHPQAAGEEPVIELPVTASRSLADYSLSNLGAPGAQAGGTS